MIDLKKQITVFTPTYNRAYILERVYKSLIIQTNKEFEWIIVDDGSTDNTKKIVDSWIKENKIDISYYYQENQGKQIAHNLGVIKSKCDLFVCLDSDDYFTNDCIEKILSTYNSIHDEITGIICKKGFINKKVNGSFPNIKYVTLMDLNYKYNYRYDTLLIYKTKLLKEHLFPKIDGEKFIPEPYVYDQIDMLGKMYLLDEKLCICEYMEDGYTNKTRELITNNSKSYAVFSKQQLYLSSSIKVKIIDAVRYTIGSWLSKDSNYIKKIDKIKYKLLIILCLPLSKIIYMKKYK